MDISSTPLPLLDICVIMILYICWIYLKFNFMYIYQYLLQLFISIYLYSIYFCDTATLVFSFWGSSCICPAVVTWSVKPGPIARFQDWLKTSTNVSLLTCYEKKRMQREFHEFSWEFLLALPWSCAISYQNLVMKSIYLFIFLKPTPQTVYLTDTSQVHIFSH